MLESNPLKPELLVGGLGVIIVIELMVTLIVIELIVIIVILIIVVELCYEGLLVLRLGVFCILSI